MRLIINSKAKAVIWDMDGVIADTAPYHLNAWQQVFQKRGVNFTEEDFRRNFGQRNDTIIRNTLGEETPQSEIDAIAREKERNFRQLVRQNIKPFPGAIKLIKLLKKHSFKMALASSAPIENIRLVIKGLGINNYFQSIICGGDVTKGKPSPQGFLLAAQRLGVEPKNCIVIEDAIAGITAAKRAGMYCLAITNTHPRQSLAEADLIVDTLEEVRVSDLERLLGIERSLVLIKPDAIQRGLAGIIISRLEREGLKLVALKMLHLDKASAKQLYAIHTDKSFFEGLVNYISSAPIIAIVFEGKKAVEVIRKTMGATDPARAEAGTIRGDFGLDIERNVIHGSDSVETAD
ncbi:nucleoside-diphosphate kinase, partial [Dehalococcoidales bacterium]|nr:nucleoside-diphosphate kinase [Dehalococcoidales bacterium]